jgi:hypothetical protein
MTAMSGEHRLTNAAPEHAQWPNAHQQHASEIRPTRNLTLAKPREDPALRALCEDLGTKAKA